MPPLPLSIPFGPHPTFNLNSAGVAGFFGGDEAISAMGTVNLYEGRRWLGWFNSPGSYTIAKRFGRMANSRFWDGLFPGSNDSPAVTFGLDGQKGPKYIAALSGTTMKTGHLGYLTMERSRQVEIDPDADTVGTRRTKHVEIGYLAMKKVDYNKPVERRSIYFALRGLIPIVVSIITCIMCALFYDWISFSMILLGIISSGLASLVIGEGMPFIECFDKPASGAPPGHGILMGVDEVLVIKGEERDVNAITKGRFNLATGKKRERHRERPEGERVTGPRQGDGGGDPTPKDAGSTSLIAMRNLQRDDGRRNDPEHGNDGRTRPDSEQQVDGRSGEVGDTHPQPRSERKKNNKNKPEQYHTIGLCSLLLIVQFLLQLILIPQGTLFGQTMFLVSLVVSWGYNSYLSSLEKERIQTDLLFQWLQDPTVLRFRAGTRTTMAVFVCLLLFHGVNPTSSHEVNTDLRLRALYACIPNDTLVWRMWREKVVKRVLNVDGRGPLEVDEGDSEFQKLDPKSKDLLKVLLGDANDAITKYSSIREHLPRDSSSGGE